MPSDEEGRDARGVPALFHFVVPRAVPPFRPARSTRPGPAGSVVWLDSAGSSPANRRAGAVNSPGPPRDGSAASHLGGRMLWLQVGPPPLSRAPILHRDRAVDNYGKRELGKTAWAVRPQLADTAGSRG